MISRKEAYEAMFNIFLKEGRVLGMRECVAKYPKEAQALRKCAPTKAIAFKRLRRIYKHRWHEIGTSVPEVINPPKEPVIDPVEDFQEPVQEEGDPLEKLRSIDE